MNLEDEQRLLVQLESDEAQRKRLKYEYTSDVLRYNGILPYSIYPETNQTIAAVIAGKLLIDDVPFDISNEYWKGDLFEDQRTIIQQNSGKPPLCEAQQMAPCLKDKCPLYRSGDEIPVCREYKMAFEI